MAKETDKKSKTIEEVKEEVGTTKKVEKKRKDVSDSIEVEFINYTNGILVYEDKNTGKSYYLGEFGDSDYITVGELRQIKSRHKAMLSNFYMLLTDVLDEDIELKDVLKKLGIEKLYENALSIEEIDNLLNKRSAEQFEKVFDKLDKNFKGRVIERALHLFNEGEFSDMYRITIMRDFTGDEELFTVKKEDK